MRAPFLYGHLLVGAIALFQVVQHLLAALRLRRERIRELTMGVSLFTLGVNSVVFFDLLSGHPHAFTLRVAGALIYVNFLFIFRVADAFGRDPERAPQTAGVDRTGVIALHLIGVIGALSDLIGDLPFSSSPAGDLHLWIVGRAAGARMSPVAVACHVGFAFTCTLMALSRTMALARSGHPELRSAPVLCMVAFPLFCLDMASLGGLSPMPPLTGYQPLTVVVFLVWRGLEQQAERVEAEEGRQKLGNYRLVKKIGTGGMAEVFVAELPGPGGFVKRVAIKRILPHLTEDPAFVAMFLEEARLAARLNHPNLVQIFELGRADTPAGDGPFYLAMELVEGLSLDLIGRRMHRTGRRFPPPLLALLTAQVLDGLEHAHRLAGPDGQPLGLVHRDVSPQNILISQAGQAKLLDFGIARAADRASRTATGALKGKIPYMAPEQACGEPIDARADLFSVGVVMHELACGQRPFDGDSDAATLRRLLDGDRPPLSQLAPDLPVPLERIIARALEPDPGRRFEGAAAMAEALRAYLTDLPEAPQQAELGRLVTSLMAELQAVRAATDAPGGANSQADGPGGAGEAEVKSEARTLAASARSRKGKTG